MRNSKKLLSLALSLAMALSLLPGGAMAAESKPERGVLTYSEHIKPQYEDAQAFNEGLAAVKKDGKWGYIDEEGKVVIPFQYDQAFIFNEGRAVVGTLSDVEDMGEDGEYDPVTDEWIPNGEHMYCYYYDAGFIDKTGKYTPFEAWYEQWDGTVEKYNGYYNSASEDVGNSYAYIFHNGYVWLDMARETPGSLFGPDGKEVKLTYQDSYTDWQGNPVAYEAEAVPYNYPVNEGFAVTEEGYYNLSTGVIVDADFEQQELDNGSRYISNRLPFNQGLAPVWICTSTWGQDSADGYYRNDTYELGFINTSGQWVIQPFPADRYWINGMETVFRVFGTTGLAMVSNAQGLYGAIDKTGKTVIPFQYEDLGLVSEGRMAFQEGGKYGYLNAGSLAVEIPNRYDNVTTFNNGLAVACEGDKVFLIDWNGEQVPGSDKLNPETYFQENEEGGRSYYPPTEYVVIQEKGKYGYGHIEYLPPLPERDEMSGWAYEEVTAAIEEDLVPTYLQCLYLNSIKREEFCDLVLQAITEILDMETEDLVKEKTGRDLFSWEQEYPFRDTSSSNAVAAYALGIVGGRDDRVFDPYATITREEAAAFLSRGAAVLGMDTDVVTPSSFTDNESVAVWARDYVSYVSQAGVMNGMDGNVFSPWETYSREQSYVTIYRLYQALLAEQG